MKYCLSIFLASLMITSWAAGDQSDDKKWDVSTPVLPFDEVEISVDEGVFQF